MGVPTRTDLERPAGPDLSVIIVTWNVRELTLQCLRSLEEQSNGIALEVFVVDNASSDGTVAAIRQEFPEVRIIENQGNVGFPRANNQALQHARGRYVLFLNPDTEVGEGTLQRCVRELDQDETLGMVGCRLVYPDGSIQYEGARRDYRLRHLACELFYLHKLFPRHPVFAHQLMGDWDHKGTREVEAICGAFMMVRRPLAYELGGLPEEVHMYHEDLAFCLRVRRAGKKIRYLGDVVTVHHHGKSSGQRDSRIWLLDGEYRIRLIREGEGPVHAAIGRVLFAIRSLLRLPVAVAASLIPGTRAVRHRYPRLFDPRLHVLSFLWSVSPRLVRRHMPQPPAGPPIELRLEADVEAEAVGAASGG